MFTSIKNWFLYTVEDFKEFGIRQFKVVVSFLVLWVLSFVAAHYFILNTDAYSISEKYIKENPILAEKIGATEYVDLQPFASTIRWSGKSGIAELELNAGNSKINCKIRLYLTKDNGEWRLQKAHAILPNHDVLVIKD